MPDNLFNLHAQHGGGEDGERDHKAAQTDQQAIGNPVCGVLDHMCNRHADRVSIVYAEAAVTAQVAQRL